MKTGQLRWDTLEKIEMEKKYEMKWIYTHKKWKKKKITPGRTDRQMHQLELHWIMDIGTILFCQLISAIVTFVWYFDPQDCIFKNCDIPYNCFLRDLWMNRNMWRRKKTMGKNYLCNERQKCYVNTKQMRVITSWYYYYWYRNKIWSARAIMEFRLRNNFFF